MNPSDNTKDKTNPASGIKRLRRRATADKKLIHYHQATQTHLYAKVIDGSLAIGAENGNAHADFKALHECKLEKLDRDLITANDHENDTVLVASVCKDHDGQYSKLFIADLTDHNSLAIKQLGNGDENSWRCGDLFSASSSSGFRITHVDSSQIGISADDKSISAIVTATDNSEGKVNLDLYQVIGNECSDVTRLQNTHAGHAHANGDVKISKDNKGHSILCSLQIGHEETNGRYFASVTKLGLDSYFEDSGTPQSEITGGMPEQVEIPVNTGDYPTTIACGRESLVVGANSGIIYVGNLNSDALQPVFEKQGNAIKGLSIEYCDLVGDQHDSIACSTNDSSISYIIDGQIGRKESAFDKDVIRDLAILRNDSLPTIAMPSSPYTSTTNPRILTNTSDLAILRNDSLPTIAMPSSPSYSTREGGSVIALSLGLTVAVVLFIFLAVILINMLYSWYGEWRERRSILNDDNCAVMEQDGFENPYYRDMVTLDGVFGNRNLDRPLDRDLDGYDSEQESDTAERPICPMMFRRNASTPWHDSTDSEEEIEEIAMSIIEDTSSEAINHNAANESIAA